MIGNSEAASPCWSIGVPGRARAGAVFARIVQRNSPHVAGRTRRHPAAAGLSWWAVDGETIQITSQPAADRLQRLELLAIPKKVRETYADNAALLAALQKELGERAPAGAAGCLLDVDGNYLIVLGNAAVERYLAQRLAGEP